MRITLVHYSAPPVIGGVESVLGAHARLFRSAGHEVTIVARRGSPDRLLAGTDPTDELAEAVHGSDIVIAHNVLTMPFDMGLTQALWTIAERNPKPRWIAWVHDVAVANPDYDFPWHQSPWDLLTRSCPHFSYLAVSSQRARQMEATSRADVRVIPNGVDPAEVLGLTPPVAAFAGKHRLLERDVVLIHPTRLLRRKNVEFGLEVIAELRRRGKDAVTMITGAADPHNERSAEYASALLRRRTLLGLDESALLVGEHFPVAPLDLTGLYQLADALFFPSRQEGFGLPVLEAALHRLPVFCADIEPMSCLLNHSLHVFDPEGSAAEVATLIQRTLDRSPTLRARRETVFCYSWDSVWRRYLEPLLRGEGFADNDGAVPCFKRQIPDFASGI
ncbi:MAG TPA: glycosyltransferase family 4 protein [Chthoniobacteraceae bacterium]|nr:glycosyltransferase family 4 protein [Chthoniobacteraceae bacterium]